MSTLLHRLRAHIVPAKAKRLLTEAAEARQSLLDQLATAHDIVAIQGMQLRTVKAAAHALLNLDLENDGATCEWPELQQALANLRAALAAAKGPGNNVESEPRL